MAEGRVACWGSNLSGQLGSIQASGASYSSAPVLVPGVTGARTLVALTSGSAGTAELDGTCALGADGGATCWGGMVPQASKLPNDRPPQALPVVSNATGLALFSNAGCELQPDGGVACWGNGTSNGILNEVGYPEPSLVAIAVPGLVGVSALTAANFRMCVIRATKDLACWTLAPLSPGDPGVGPPTGAVAPVTAIEGVTDVTSIAASGYDLYASSASGEVFHLDFVLTNVPVAKKVADISNAVSVTTGDDFACALLRDRTVSCWGSKFYDLGGGRAQHGERVEDPITVQAQAL